MLCAVRRLDICSLCCCGRDKLANQIISLLRSRINPWLQQSCIRNFKQWAYTCLLCVRSLSNVSFHIYFFLLLKIRHQGFICPFYSSTTAMRISPLILLLIMYWTLQWHWMCCLATFVLYNVFFCKLSFVCFIINVCGLKIIGPYVPQVQLVPGGRKLWLQRVSRWLVGCLNT